MITTFKKSIRQSNYFRFKKIQIIDQNKHPFGWWRDHDSEFPLLAKFFKANSSFQATSLSSERLFNKDKMLFGQTRQSLTPELTEGLVFLADYYNRRSVKEEFVICPSCPKPPLPGNNYKKTCRKHKKV